VDIARQITTPDLDTPEAIAEQVRVLTAQSAIRDLAALYSMAVDDHDIEGVLTCFAKDGSFKRAGIPNKGHEALRAFYISMMDRYVTTLHTPHTHTIAVNGETASGILTGHAELSLQGTLMMTAYRYIDEYVRESGRWVFASRELQSMYVVPFEAMGSSFRDEIRIRWPQTTYQAAAFPETLPTWNSYKD
jgi:uncharacterized protein (TIGR02246 family)